MSAGIRTVLLGAIAMLAAGIGGAEAGALSQKLCISSAAQRLPAIPGLVIVASRADPMPRNPKDGPNQEWFATEIDTRAAAQEMTFGFLCAVSDGKRAMVEPTGIVR